MSKADRDRRYRETERGRRVRRRLQAKYASTLKGRIQRQRMIQRRAAREHEGATHASA